MQLVPMITLTGIAARGVDAVMITASIFISTLVDVCNSMEGGGMKKYQ